MQTLYSCGICPDKPCTKGNDNYPKNCPTNEEKGLIDVALNEYKTNDVINRIMNFANSIPIGDDGEFRSRAEEIIELINRMGFKKVGIAFCYSMERKVKKFIKMFDGLDVELVPVCCKAGGLEIDRVVDIPKNNKRFIASCNPIAQAEIMNKADTEINVVVGLCVGHDIVFNKYVNGYVTTLIAKDRKFNHNPIEHFKESN